MGSLYNMASDPEEFDMAETMFVAGEMERGSVIMIKGHPCKVAEVSKTGKGPAKIHAVGIDIFTGKTHEDVFPSSLQIPINVMTEKEYQVVSADRDSGEVCLVNDDGSMKEDIMLPAFANGTPTDADRRLSDEIVKLVEDYTTMVTVRSACNMQKIIACRNSDKD